MIDFSLTECPIRLDKVILNVLPVRDDPLFDPKIITIPISTATPPHIKIITNKDNSHLGQLTRQTDCNNTINECQWCGCNMCYSKCDRCELYQCLLCNPYLCINCSLDP